MGGTKPKQFLSLGGEPLVVHCLRVLQASSLVDEIILAVPEADLDYCANDLLRQYGLSKVKNVVRGGTERQDSVRLALEHVPDRVEIIVVHDAVRPFLTETMIRDVVEAAKKHGAAIVALPMRDTVKQVGPDHVIQQTVDRRRLWLAQTPQAFRRQWLKEAHHRAHAEGVQATDDAFLIEWLGHPVVVVEGTGENVKVTRPEDMVIGEAIWASHSACGKGAEHGK
jgi:2-C-methyl-D-erythritol 4-phosphate cytidylyltransferase